MRMVGEKNARELGAGSGGRRLMKRLQGRLSLEKPQRVMGGADAEPKAKGRLQVETSDSSSSISDSVTSPALPYCRQRACQNERARIRTEWRGVASAARVAGQRRRGLSVYYHHCG